MTNPIDLTLISIRRSDPNAPEEIPGVFVGQPSLRSGHGRRNERLIIYLMLSGNAPLAAEQQEQLLARTAQAYFKVSGASTAALRAAGDTLNQFLLDRNRRSLSNGLQTTGQAAFLVLRGGSLYAALSGSMSVYQVSQLGVRQFMDPSTNSRGLGLARTAPLYFTSIQLNPGDLLLATPQAAIGWDGVTLTNLRKLPLDRMAGLLLERAVESAQAVAIQAAKGSGRVQVLGARTGFTTAAQAPATTPTPVSTVEPFQPEPLQEELETPQPLAAAPGASQEFPLDDQPLEAAPEAADVVSQQAGTVVLAPRQPVPAAAPAPPAAPAPEAQAPKRPKARRRPLFAPLAGAVVGSAQAAQSTTARIGQAFATLLRRILPDESLLTLPSSVMAFFAVVVPLVIVTIASTVYYQRGKATQYEVAYAQAIQAAGYARSLSNPPEQSQAWKQVLDHLSEAEIHQVTDTSKILRQEAQSNLDGLDLIQRLDFQPALVAALPADAVITRISTSTDELYLFDRHAGIVYRAFKSGRGYELDLEFQCSGTGVPGTPGAMIDITPAVKGNNWGAVLLGITGDGQIVQCASGKASQATPLAPPQTGWGKPVAIAQDLGSLYVLDPEAQAVWTYQSGDFGSAPRLFFDDQIPQLDDAIDLAADRDDLYLLHRDGRVTLCTFSAFAVAPTRCTDPAPYRDSRPGRENQVLLPDSPFTRLLAVQPPDPSLYLLAGEAQSVYRFSLRLLTYDRQFALVDPAILGSANRKQAATAVALSPDNRVIFFAFGSQLLYAAIP